MFHAPMFALNADAERNACAPSHPRSTPTGRRLHGSAQIRVRPIAHARAHRRTRGRVCGAAVYVAVRMDVCVMYIEPNAEPSGPIAAAPSMLCHSTSPCASAAQPRSTALRAVAYKPHGCNRHNRHIDLMLATPRCAISARASGGRQHTLAIVETLATFHLEMSSLNVGRAVDEG